MTISFRSIALIVVGIIFFLALVVSASTTGFFGDALDPFIGPFIQSSSLTTETFTSGRPAPTPTIRR
jgi:hypothetical protein